MSNDSLEKEREFFVTGVRTYVDVDDATAEFRRLVQHKCRAVVSANLGDLNQTCGTLWKTSDLSDYVEKTVDHHYIGKQVEVKGLGKLYFCLRLSREGDSRPFDAFVFLYRIRRELATGLWDRAGASDSVSWKGRNNIGFGRPIPEDQISNFEECLRKAVTDFLDFINECGGINKYLAPWPNML